MVELIINGKAIELLKKGQEIKYTRQIADVFDIASVASSYTNSFTIPKTPNNTQIFEHLGIVGDQSSIPYTRTPVTSKNQGFDLIREGWLNVSETSEEYKCSIIDGMVDFFKAIENKTIGVDLDLSNFEHQKSMESIINSFDNEYYNYIIADFEAKNFIVSFFPLEFAINIDYLVPSFSVKKLMELIFSTFGYTYESQELDDYIDGLFITYPTPPLFETTDEDIIATLNKGFWASNQIVQDGDKYYVPSEREWDSSTITDGTLINNLYFSVPETDTYKVKMSIEAYAKYTTFGTTFRPATVDIYKNNQVIATFQTDPNAPVEKELNIFLQAGDQISYLLYTETSSFGSGFDFRALNEFRSNSTVMEIFKVTQGDVSPSNAFKTFKIKDFFKEILYRTGLTPIAYNIEKKITFISVDERIDISKAIDWTDKFIRRKKEIYIKNSYAQRNLLKMKYNDGHEAVNDGIILVNNKNIEEEKTLATSLLYSPIDGTTEFRPISGSSIYTSIIPMFTKELSQGEENEPIIEYKKMDNRFYFIRKNTVNDRNWRLKSELVPDEETVSELHFATTENTLLGQMIAEKFSGYSKLFNNFRAHDIELALGLEDVLNLDLTKPYYFKQEAGYYILNKLSFQDGETTTGEFVRINQ